MELLPRLLDKFDKFDRLELLIAGLIGAVVASWWRIRWSIERLARRLAADQGANASALPLLLKRSGFAAGSSTPILQFVTCATPGYLEAHGTPRHPSDLESGHQMVRYFFAGTNRRLAAEFVRDGERLNVDADYFVAVNDSNAVLAAALAGLGVLQTLRFMAQPHFQSGALVPLLEEWSLGPNPI
jgi:hypothetical protein